MKGSIHKYLSFNRFFICIIISLAFHLTLLYSFQTETKEEYKIYKKTGGIYLGSVNQKKSSSQIENSNSSIGSQEEGNIEEEIIKLKNSITFPEEALERRLEDECEWTVKLGENQKAEEIIKTRNCKYEIFERQFQKAVRNWKFELTPGTVLKIPVSFKIKERNE